MIKELYSNKLLLFTIGFGFIVSLIPIFYFDFAPLENMPQYLARVHIMRNYFSNGTFQSFYTFNLKPIPNIAMEIFTNYIFRFIPLFMATKLFLALNFILTIGGVLFIHYQTYKKFSLWTLTTFLLLYNGFFIRGFINYNFAVALMLITFGFWLYYDSKHQPKTQIIVTSILATCTYFSHIFPFVLLGIIIGTYEVNKLLINKASFKAYFNLFTRCSLSFLIPACLLLIYIHGHFASQTNYYWDYFDKFINIPLFNFTSDDFWLSVLTTFIFYGVIVILFLARQLSLPSVFILPLITLMIMHFVMPDTFGSDSATASIRILYPLTLLFLSVTTLKLKKDKIIKGLYLIFSGLFLCRMLSIFLSWQHLTGPIYKEYEEIAQNITEKSRISSILYIPSFEYSNYFPYSGNLIYNTPLTFFHVFLVIKKSAIVSDFYTDPMQQPLLVKPDQIIQSIQLTKENLPFIHLPRDNPKSPFFHYNTSNIDYVLLQDEQGAIKSLPEFLQEIYKTKNLTLYKIKK